MTPPKRWPNSADYARTESIALARKCLLQMEPMKSALDEGEIVSSYELSRRMGTMSDNLHRMIELLSSVGPQNFID